MSDKALMVDLETLDTADTAVIVAIGACCFNPRGEEIFGTFSANISIESNMELGRTVSGSTLTWWFNQPPEAQQAFQTNPTSLRNALILYRKFIEEQQPTTHWANSPQFDHAILRSAYASCGYNIPWSFWQERDFRTAKHFCFPNNDMPDFMSEHGVAHAALDDALKQATGLQFMFQKMGV